LSDLSKTNPETDRVSLNQVVDSLAASVSDVPAPDTLALEEQKNNHSHAVQRTTQGLIGRVLGAGSEKAGNVAAIVILFSFIALGVAFFFGAKPGESPLGESFFKLLAAFTGLVGLALGYLFGSDKK
jgi:hypothetical protein